MMMTEGGEVDDIVPQFSMISVYARLGGGTERPIKICDPRDVLQLLRPEKGCNVRKLGSSSDLRYERLPSFGSSVASLPWRPVCLTGPEKCLGAEKPIGLWLRAGGRQGVNKCRGVGVLNDINEDEGVDGRGGSYYPKRRRTIDWGTTVGGRGSSFSLLSSRSSGLVMSGPLVPGHRPMTLFKLETARVG
nr:hypothetical protein Iba_chr13fCG7080 [Ipomoea batatas]